MGDPDLVYKLFLVLVMVASTAQPPAPGAYPTPTRDPNATPTAPVIDPTALPGDQAPTGKVTPWIGGIELSSISQNGGLGYSLDANAYWVRRNGMLWSDVEPTEGARNWNAIGTLGTELINASNRGMQVVLVVRSTPTWAQRYSGVFCGPPKASKFAAFAAFMYDVVARYSQPPYNVRYWMIGNEPDVDYRIVDPKSPYGCWGNQDDAYYDGGHYGEMLKAVYPAIKAANPSASVVIGGLLTDCDPRDPPPGKGDCRSSKFLEGILRAGAGNSFDGVAIHAYDGYSYKLGNYGDANWHADWVWTGTLLKEKVGFAREVLAKYNATGKYVMMSEGGLLCWGCTRYDADYEETKSYYMLQLYATAVALDVKAAIWYAMQPYWEQIDLLDYSGKPKPALAAFKQAQKRLGGATLIGEIDPDQDTGKSWGVRGYKFKRGSITVWAMWSTSETKHTIKLPTKPSAIYDVYGATLAASQEFQLSLKPVYIEWK